MTDYRSNCCNAEIYIVRKQKYGICRDCFTRIGYHDEKDNAKYDPYNIGFEEGREQIVEEIKRKVKELKYSSYSGNAEYGHGVAIKEVLQILKQMKE